jgi:hypothetical protein
MVLFAVHCGNLLLAPVSAPTNTYQVLFDSVIASATYIYYPFIADNNNNKYMLHILYPGTFQVFI